MCAILSAMDKHHDALIYAKKAIEIAQEQLVDVKFSDNSDDIANNASVLGIAYYNYAVEEEYLGNLQGAIDNYEKAYNIVVKNAPNNIQMINKFKENLFQLKQKETKASRPSSAKSGFSAKSMKSGVTVKSSHTTSRPLKGSKRVSNKKSDISATSMANSEFQQFTNQCKQFLSSNKE